MTLKSKIFVLAILLGVNAFSQERKIIGRIIDYGTQKPVKNVTIVILGTTSGTFSNHLGYFELSVDAAKHKTLVVSHVGYKTSEILIPTEDRFKFLLEKEYILLNQINLSRYPSNLTDELTADESKPKNETGLIVIESGALFPTGMDNFYNYIGNSLTSKITQLNEKGFTVTFTIDENGQAVDVLISDSTESVTSAVREAFLTMPKWIPATQRQNKVLQHFVLPVVRLDIPDIKSLDLKDFYEFIGPNIKYPALARQTGVEGTVYIEFHVDNAGSVVSSKLLKDIGADCGEEGRRIIAATPTELTKSLMAKTNYNKFILPISFGLGKPYKGKPYTPNSDALLLNEVAVTAIGIQREFRAVGRPYGLYQTNPKSVVLPASYTYNNLIKALEDPKTVKRLALVSNNLDSFPLDILKLNNLESLDLEKNNLHDLPNEIELLTKLEELYLFENQLQSLPSNFGNLKKLKLLGIASNQLTSFPLEITLLNKLEALDLSNNQLASLPTEIGALKNLKVLILNNNTIKTLPPEFYQLNKLEEINFQGNPIDAKEIELLKKTFKKAEIVFE